MAKKISTKIRAVPSALSQNQRVTRKELYLVRDELKSEFRATHSLIEQKAAESNARFASLETKLENLSTDIQKALILHEEQHQNNRIVLEGHELLWQSKNEDYSKIKKTLQIHGIELE